ncbi:MAG: glycosyltransferase family 4 protein [Alcanivorax sp.]|nr:glycosyltransferase family 4 protein [Alcanivorax sp.]
MGEKKVSVCLEHRFYRVGHDVYTALNFPYSYWREYLDFFDQVNVVARVKHVKKVEEGFVKASGDMVFFDDVPYYHGFKSFIITLPLLLLHLGKVVSREDFFLLRSGNVSNIAFIFIILFRKKFISEYPGNVKEGIIGLVGDSISLRFIANLSDWFSRLQGRCSRANSFVSEYCRSLYGSSRPSFVFSSFNSDEINFRKGAYLEAFPRKLSLVSVGRLEREKGHYVLLQALSEMRERGVPTSLTLIGDGGDRLRLEKYVSSEEIDVHFLGVLTDRDKLFSAVISGDVFVIPSLTEGMPRALLEAMAMGMPCVGSNVGGIPEVLSGDCMVVPGDAHELADTLSSFCDPELRRQHGERNHKVIHEKFSNDALKERRHHFWSKLYD